MPATATVQPTEEKNIVAFDRPGRLPNQPALPTAEAVSESLANMDPPATERQIAAAVWLINTARALGLSTFAAIGQFIRRDTSMVSRWLRGQYKADLTNLTEHVERFRADWSEQQKLGEMPFVPQLAVVKQIGTFCEMVRLTRQIAPIWGDSQTGKTWGLGAVANDESKDTIYVRLVANGTQKSGIDALAEACGVPTRKADDEKRERILRRIKPQTLVIIDEFHQAFIGRKLKLGLIERIRELNDLCGCGVVLCGTSIFMDMLQSPKFTEFLSQIERRGVLRLFIPTEPMEGDLALLFSAYHLPPPKGEVAKLAKRISKEKGIGQLTKYFQVSRMLASNDGAPAMTWEHFQKTHDTLTTLGGKLK